MKRKKPNVQNVDVNLRLDWCSHKAAKYAVEKWHYSAVMPSGKTVKIGIWEDTLFKGCILFSRGANNHIGNPFNLNQTEVCELTRVALRSHITPVTRLIRIAITFLRDQSPGIRLIISYADPQQNHVGGIYQAGNWVYAGKSQAQREVMVDGKMMHKRTANSLFGTIKGLEKSPVFFKHKYLMPLDKVMRKQVEPLRESYPKKCGGPVEGEKLPVSRGGATPTSPLQN